MRIKIIGNIEEEIECVGYRVNDDENVDVFYDENGYDGDYKTFQISCYMNYTLSELVDDKWIIRDRHNCRKHK